MSDDAADRATPIEDDRADSSTEMTKITAFEQELTHLINRHSMENGSDTPDFMLAEYLRRCLESFNAVVRKRNIWYGRATEEHGELDIKLGLTGVLQEGPQTISKND